MLTSLITNFSKVTNKIQLWAGHSVHLDNDTQQYKHGRRKCDMMKTISQKQSPQGQRKVTPNALLQSHVCSSKKKRKCSLNCRTTRIHIPSIIKMQRTALVWVSLPYPCSSYRLQIFNKVSVCNTSMNSKSLSPSIQSLINFLSSCFKSHDPNAFFKHSVIYAYIFQA